jgi:hypothetical protein
MSSVGWVPRLFLGAVTVAVLAGCGGPGRQLRQLADSPSAQAVVKDAKGALWALPGSAVASVSGSRVTLREGALVASCAHGEGPREMLAGSVSRILDNGPTGSFGLREISGTPSTVTTTGPDGKETTRTEGQAWRVWDCDAGAARAGATVDVVEVLRFTPAS